MFEYSLKELNAIATSELIKHRPRILDLKVAVGDDGSGSLKISYNTDLDKTVRFTTVTLPAKEPAKAEIPKTKPPE